MKTSIYEEFDEALLQWVGQLRSEDTPTSGPIIAAKVKQFFEKLVIERTFDESSGWLTKFKQCHGIREIGLHGDKLSCYNQAVEHFENDFQEFLKSEL